MPFQVVISSSDAHTSELEKQYTSTLTSEVVLNFFYIFFIFLLDSWSFKSHTMLFLLAANTVALRLRHHTEPSFLTMATMTLRLEVIEL